MSSLLESDFSFTSSETVESTSASLYSKKTAFIWKYSRRPKEDENQILFYYSYCKLDFEISPYGINLTGNLTKYIKKKHFIVTIEKILSKN
jgi:hypothetical protein